MTDLARTFRAMLGVAALCMLAACAQPARVTQMVVPNVMAPVVAANPSLQGSLAVGDISGGQATNPLWTSQVDNPEFKEALEQSLQANAMLAPNATASRYVVAAQLRELKQPLIGFDMQVTPRVAYKVVERANQATVFEEELTTPYTASFSAAFVAVERLRLANEGAIRESIKRFLERFTETWISRTPGATPARPVPMPATTPSS
ncbi:MAG: hypothetical protein JNK67_07000 [Alphaproteobacteria bacterium]|nr:hypothetical protein [Alphaproteobacteria bacterium]